MIGRILTVAMASVLAGLIAGCGQTTPPSPSSAEQSAAVPHKAGAQLWAENCSRCHNIRPPESFNDAQWQAVVHHMRLRADLTGEDAREITVFLQASH